MPYYKDNNNEIYALASADLEHTLPSGCVPISNDEANAIVEENKIASFNELSYIQKRIREYPPFTDYLDAIVKGDTKQLESYISACNAVKLKYPKEF